MLKLSGKIVHKGIALGPVAVWKKQARQPEKKKAEDPQAEILRLQKAGEHAQARLQMLYHKALEEVGEAGAAIFEAQRMLLRDEGYLDFIHQMIRTEKVSAEYAVAAAGENFSQMFMNMDDEYMRDRAADMREISEHLISSLTGSVREDYNFDEPVILMADDLSPGETICMDRKKILAFVTVHGSVHSHTAILAGMMGVPALAGVPVNPDQIPAGTQAVVDGFQGEVIFDPDEKLCRQVRIEIQREREREQLLHTLKGKESVTLDGKKVSIYANLNGPGDIEAVLENDAEGIGLFRSEFLYMGRQQFPTEEEQFQAYRQVLQSVNGRKVIIRTLDIGADKQISYFDPGEEKNPAMGYRGIRICLKQTDIFTIQLRALFRAAVYGNLSVMYPMITSTEEVLEIYALAKKVQEELEREKISYKVPEQGIMIETPAAVMISDELAELVDFFSIGTNDLIQYTLAVDRQNEKLEDFYRPHHKAILKMIRMTVENAHKCGIWTGICGELGADLELTEEFLRMGIDELSVTPSMVLPLRQAVRRMNLSGSSCACKRK